MGRCATLRVATCMCCLESRGMVLQPYALLHPFSWDDSGHQPQAMKAKHTSACVQPSAIGENRCCFGAVYYKHTFRFRHLAPCVQARRTDCVRDSIGLVATLNASPNGSLMGYRCARKQVAEPQHAPSPTSFAVGAWSPSFLLCFEFRLWNG